jgi:branched-chain amino acid transport system permease protein
LNSALKYRSAIASLLCLVIGIVAPLVIGSGPDHLGDLDYILAIIMVTCGLNIVLGFAGVLFLGPGALFITGSYLAAALASHFTLLQTLPAMCVVSVAASLVLAAIAALPTLRVSGFYLGMITLFLALIVPTIASHLSYFGGSQGLSLETVFTFTQHPGGVPLYEIGVALIVVLCGMSWLILHSRLGRQLIALRAGEDLAQSVGIHLYGIRLTAFLLAAIPCGIGGAFYVYSTQFVSPDSVTATTSIYILAGLVVGGSGTVLGPVVGSALVMAVYEFLGQSNKFQGAMFGVVLIAVAMILPAGIVGFLREQTDKLAVMWSARRGATDVGEPGIPRPRPAEEAGPGAEAQAAGAGAAVSLVITKVARSFGGVRAVRDVDLCAEPGKVHALVGTNGSGKTTLLNLVSGFHRSEAGTISLGAARFSGLTATEVARRGVARTFQTPKLSLDTSVLDNVLIGAEMDSPGTSLSSVIRTPSSVRASRVARRRAENALAIVGLSDISGVMAGKLSHGMQRLVEIARAVSRTSTVVLLDEPAAGLSLAEVEVLTRVVRRLASEGLIVLLVEHNLPIVFDLADVVTVMDQGSVIAHGLPEEISANADVIRVYLGAGSSSVAIKVQPAAAEGV